MSTPDGLLLGFQHRYKIALGISERHEQTDIGDGVRRLHIGSAAGGEYLLHALVDVVDRYDDVYVMGHRIARRGEEAAVNCTRLEGTIPV